MICLKQVHVDAVIRQEKRQGALHHLRTTGLIPAVVYGGNGPALAIAVSERALVGDVAADLRFVELSVNGQNVPAMIQEVQRHPVSKKIIHADFCRVDRHHPTDVTVPVQLHGADLAKKRGFIVQQQARGITVRALPQKVPEFFIVDVSTLKAGAHLSVGEVALPDDVELLSDPSEILVSALVPSRGAVVDEAEDETAASADPS